ncbi:MAG: phasin family protein [Erythrobacter sp.]
MSEVETTAAAAKAAPIAKIDAAAEKAYAEAAAKAAEAAKAEKPAVVKQVAAPKKPVAAKPAAKKVPAKKVPAKKVAAPKKAPVKPIAAKQAAKVTAAPSTNPVIKLKDTIMATAKNTDITATAKEMLADVQTRAKTAAATAYAKTTELAGEATEFGKANVEAVVESSKIFFAGAQDIVKSDIEAGKAVLETVTEDAKKVAAVKSPTELMQLQGEIARRNFDALVSFGSKRTEAWVKLYNDVFAPISNRVSVAAEKISKAA